MVRSASLLGTVVVFLACGGGAPEPAQSPAQQPPAIEPASQSLSPEDCQAQSGEVLHDVTGCPDGRAQLGTVTLGSQTALCCALSSSAPAEPPTGKRSPCTLGADQTCNEDPKVSALWGKCTEQGTCVCNAGFELSPGGYCRPAP